MAEALDPAIPEDVEQLAQAVLDAACAQELRLATAESCTGGLLASLLTDIPGKSHTFERGFVTYTDEAKRELLDVPQDVLDRDGAVSEAAAFAMAAGALAASRADIAIAVTGFTDGAPPGCDGLVYVARASRGSPPRCRCVRLGDRGRAEVRMGALRAALSLLQEGLDEIGSAA